MEVYGRELQESQVRPRQAAPARAQTGRVGVLAEALSAHTVDLIPTRGSDRFSQTRNSTQACPRGRAGAGPRLRRSRGTPSGGVEPRAIRRSSGRGATRLGGYVATPPRRRSPPPLRASAHISPTQPALRSARLEDASETSSCCSRTWDSQLELGGRSRSRIVPHPRRLLPRADAPPLRPSEPPTLRRVQAPAACRPSRSRSPGRIRELAPAHAGAWCPPLLHDVRAAPVRSRAACPARNAGSRRPCRRSSCTPGARARARRCAARARQPSCARLCGGSSGWRHPSDPRGDRRRPGARRRPAGRGRRRPDQHSHHPTPTRGQA